MTPEIADRHFIRLAWLTAINLSKDPRTVVGCCIVSSDFRQLCMGFNGLPKGIEETKELWSPEIKHSIVIHAEEAALLHSNFDTKGALCFCTHRPCHRCLGRLATAEISRIVYNEDYKREANLQDEELWNNIAKQFKEIKRVSDDNFLVALKVYKDDYRLSNFFKS